jgi:RNA polymerase sigma factor (sigma-70 family)
MDHNQKRFEKLLADRLSGQFILQNRALEELYVMVKRLVKMVVFNYGKNIHHLEREDLVQEITIKILSERIMRMYVPGKNWTNWAGVIAKNSVLDVHRSSKESLFVHIDSDIRANDLKPLQITDYSLSETNIQCHPLSKKLWKVVNTLSLNHRKMILLWYKFKMNQDEIASFFAIQPNKVGVIKFRALDELKKKMANSPQVLEAMYSM